MYKFSILIGVMVISSFIAGCGGGPACPDFGNSEPIFSYQISVKIFGVTFEKKIEIDLDGDRKPTQDLLKPYEKEWEESFFKNIPSSTPVPVGYVQTSCPCTPTATMIPTAPTDVPTPTGTPCTSLNLGCLTEDMVETAKKVGIEELEGIYSQKIFINGWIPIRLRNHLLNNGFIISDKENCDFILCSNDTNKITKEDFQNNEAVLMTTKNGRGVVSGTMLCKESDDLFLDWDRSLYTPIKIIGMYYKK
ncbi:MAG TPA: hypothetical protein PLZ62_00550 [bacterium]|nr:hypothetical protein [bacterium]